MRDGSFREVIGQRYGLHCNVLWLFSGGGGGSYAGALLQAQVSRYTQHRKVVVVSITIFVDVAGDTELLFSPLN